MNLLAILRIVLRVLAIRVLLKDCTFTTACVTRTSVVVRTGASSDDATRYSQLCDSPQQHLHVYVDCEISRD